MTEIINMTYFAYIITIIVHKYASAYFSKIKYLFLFNIKL